MKDEVENPWQKKFNTCFDDGVPEELQNLSTIEKSLIRRVVPFVQCIMKKQMRFYRGYSICVP
jgi:hypothetical protein